MEFARVLGAGRCARSLTFSSSSPDSLLAASRMEALIGPPEFVLMPLMRWRWNFQSDGP